MLGIKTKKDRMLKIKDKEILDLLTKLIAAYLEINKLRDTLADLRLSILSSRKVTDSELIEGVIESIRQQF